MLGSTRVRKSAAQDAPAKAKKPHKRGAKKRFQPNKQPLQARSRATYDSMLDAAARLLERHGYAALTTNHVADAAGVAIGSLYEYFPNKDVIVAEVVRRTMAEVAREVVSSFQQALRQGFETELGHWIGACFAALSRRARLMRVLWLDVPFLWELEEVQALPALMMSVARQGVPGATSPWLLADPEAATFLLTVMIRAAIMEGVVARPDTLTMAQVEQSLTRLLQLVLIPG